MFTSLVVTACGTKPVRSSENNISSEHHHSSEVSNESSEDRPTSVIGPSSLVSSDSEKLSSSNPLSSSGSFSSQYHSSSSEQSSSVHSHFWNPVYSFDKDYHWQTCIGCSEINNKGPHEWDNGTVIVEPGKKTPGEMTYKCKVCNATRTEEIEPLGTGELTPEQIADITNAFNNLESITLSTSYDVDPNSVLRSNVPARDGVLVIGNEFEESNIHMNETIKMDGDNMHYHTDETQEFAYHLQDEYEYGIENWGAEFAVIFPTYEDYLIDYVEYLASSQGVSEDEIMEMYSDGTFASSDASSGDYYCIYNEAHNQFYYLSYRDDEFNHGHYLRDEEMEDGDDETETYFGLIVAALNSGAFNEDLGAYVYTDSSVNITCTAYPDKGELVKVRFEGNIHNDFDLPYLEYEIADINNTNIDIPAIDPICENEHHKNVYISNEEGGHRRRCDECGLYVGDLEPHNPFNDDYPYCPSCGVFFDEVEDYTLPSEFNVRLLSSYSGYLYTSTLIKPMFKNANGDIFTLNYPDGFASFRDDLLPGVTAYYSWDNGNGTKLFIRFDNGVVNVNSCKTIYKYVFSVYTDLESGSFSSSGGALKVGGTPLADWLETHEPMTSIPYNYLVTDHAENSNLVPVPGETCAYYNVTECASCGEFLYSGIVYEHTMGEIEWIYEGHPDFDEDLLDEINSTTMVTINIYGRSVCTGCGKVHVYYLNAAFDVNHVMKAGDPYIYEYEVNDDGLEYIGGFYYHYEQFDHVLDENGQCVYCGATPKTFEFDGHQVEVSFISKNASSYKKPKIYFFMDMGIQTGLYNSASEWNTNSSNYKYSADLSDDTKDVFALKVNKTIDGNNYSYGFYIEALKDSSGSYYQYDCYVCKGVDNQNIKSEVFSFTD